MLNFATELDGPTKAPADQSQTVRNEAPAVQEAVTLTPAEPYPPQTQPKAPALPQTGPAHVPTQDWETLRDYVIDQITACHGVFPRDVRRENTIFMGFADRWQDLAMPIARYAFEQASGTWLGAPVSVARFAKTSDQVFAQEIARLL